MNRHFQGGGNAEKRIDRDRLFPAFNLSDVIAVQVGFLRQDLLRVAAAFSMSADRLTNDLTVFDAGGGHTTYGNRRSGLLLPSIACIFGLHFGPPKSAMHRQMRHSCILSGKP